MKKNKNDPQIIQKNIDDLKPYEKNPRRNDAAVSAVAASIRNYGFKVPIVIDKDGVIVTGHTRYRAAKKLGLEAVPVILADDLTPTQIKEFRLADNKTAELASWDDALLREELLELDADTMSEFGFEDILLDDDSAGGDSQDSEDDDSYSAPEDVHAVLRGDLFRLGSHFLLCGDGTAARDVQTLLSAAGKPRVDLVLTDPPYGIDIVSRQSGKVGGDKAATFGKGKIGGDHVVPAGEYMPIKGDDTTDTARKHYRIVRSLAENQIFFGGQYFTDFLPPRSCWIAWDKVNGESNFADIELAWTSLSRGSRLYRYMWNGMAREGDRKSELLRRVHPTQKPVGLLKGILGDFSRDEADVLDCFGGSGSTLIACEATGRRCLMMEIEPYYAGLIIDRWEQYTDRKAEKVN